ncbi:MAG: aminotransferase class I/II-fold pyridoxal phosphate-dependent enzyme [bacterium]|nr:aminotransferase class I/II-fold pyridoxal phosphate-dependent enzyme [bacterium]
MNLHPKSADRIKNLPEYLFIKLEKKVEEIKKKGKKVVSLGIGDPDMPTPRLIIDAMKEAIFNPVFHRYPLGYGLERFRVSVKNFYKKRFGVSVDESYILPVIGSKDAIAHLPVGFLNPGDYVIVPEPGYPVYSIWSKFLGAKVYKMPLLEKNNFLPELYKIPTKVLNKAKILWLNYPNNPTTATCKKEFLKEVIDFAKKYNIIVAYDNAYSEIYFSEPPISILEISKKNVIEINSLSKTFNMTGWRIGWVCGDETVVRVLAKVKENTDSGVFHAIQYAASVGLDNYAELSKPIREVYKNRRKVFFEALNNKGIKYFDGGATFYVWFKVPMGYSSESFARKLIEKGVVLTPGSSFGSVAEGWMRASLTAKDEDIKYVANIIKSL